MQDFILLTELSIRYGLAFKLKRMRGCAPNPKHRGSNTRGSRLYSKFPCDVLSSEHRYSAARQIQRLLSSHYGI